MELTSKQRAQLRAMANDLDTILYIGKDGISDNTVRELNNALTVRELVKGKVQEAAPLTPREACDELCRLCRAEPVQVIGSKFVVYRMNHDPNKKDKIVLVSAKRSAKE